MVRPRKPAHESEHERHERWLDRIEHKIDATLEVVKKMAISQDQFDTDLAALLAAETANGEAVTNLIAAVEAAIAAKPPADLTAEDNQVLAAAQAAGATAQQVADEIAKLTPPPAG